MTMTQPGLRCESELACQPPISPQMACCFRASCPRDDRHPPVGRDDPHGDGRAEEPHAHPERPDRRVHQGQVGAADRVEAVGDVGHAQELVEAGGQRVRVLRGGCLRPGLCERGRGPRHGGGRREGGRLQEVTARGGERAVLLVLHARSSAAYSMPHGAREHEDSSGLAGGPRRGRTRSRRSGPGPDPGSGSGRGPARPRLPGPRRPAARSADSRLGQRDAGGAGAVTFTAARLADGPTRRDAGRPRCPPWGPAGPTRWRYAAIGREPGGLRRPRRRRVAVLGPVEHGVPGVPLARRRDRRRRSANDPIRLLTVAHLAFPRQRPARRRPGRGRSLRPQSVRGFSAACYYFARELQQTVQVPMGLVNASWGGAAIEAWMGESGLGAVGGFDERLDLLRRTRRPGGGEPAARPRVGGLVALDAARHVRALAAGPRRCRHLARGARADARLEDVGRARAGESRRNGLVSPHLQPDRAAGRRAATLSLGGIDEVDETWVNGRRHRQHLRLGRPARLLAPGRRAPRG